MDNRQTEIKALQQYVQKSKEELQKLEQQLKEQKVCCVWAAWWVLAEVSMALWFVAHWGILSFLWKAVNSLHY